MVLCPYTGCQTAARPRGVGAGPGSRLTCCSLFFLRSGEASAGASAVHTRAECRWMGLKKWDSGTE